jgi:hypothetical protein
MTLERILDTASFFCVTTDLYGNNLLDVQGRIGRPSGNSELTSFPYAVRAALYIAVALVGFYIVDIHNITL